MADNIDVTPGTGKTIAADEVGSVLYQRVKIGVGVADVAPTDLAYGAAAAASSLPVTQSTEDVARIGALTETAPSTDTGSSGLNGRLQRVAQKLTTTNAGIGGVSDAAWTSGDGSVISVLKALASDTTAADVNLTKIGGTAVSAAAPVPAQLSQGGAVLSNTNPLWSRKRKVTPKRLGTVTGQLTPTLTSACTLDFIWLASQEASAKCWVQIFDSASAVTLSSATPVLEFDLAAGEKLIMSDLGVDMANGVVVAVTTTQKGSSSSATGATINLGTV